MGRTSIAPCSAPGIRRGVLDRLVHRRAFEDEVAAERLLHLCVRPVGHERLAVADAHGRRITRRREFRSADHDAGLARFVRERAVLRVHGFPLVGGECVPTGCIAVDQCHELHASSSSRVHTTTIHDRRDRQALAISAESIRSSSVLAPVLSSISFRFPHFGLCTHDGQPLVHGQRWSRCIVSSTQPSKLANPRAVRPMPPVWPS